MRPLDLMRPESIYEVYSFKHPLNSGKFGDMKKAIGRNGLDYAVKCIEKANLGDEDIANLYREVNILSSVSHPNIVELCELFEDDNTFFMVFEFLSGGSLEERIQSEGAMKESDALALMVTIVDALHYCHSLGIVHRDLKVVNIPLVFYSNSLARQHNVRTRGI